MTDLLTPEIETQFRLAMRDVTDTFFKSTVQLLRPSGELTDLQCNWRVDDKGSYGAVGGESYVQEEHRETVERYQVTFNVDYLIEQGIIDTTYDIMDLRSVTISDRDRVVMEGKRYSILKVQQKGNFRHQPLLIQLTVQR